MKEKEVFLKGCKANLIKPSKADLNILVFRWIFIVVFIPLYYISSSIKTNYFIFYETFALACIYNIFVSVKLINNRHNNKRVLCLMTYIDIILVSVFLYQTGGTASDAYIVYFFIIAYSAVNDKLSYTFKITVFGLILYNFTCIFRTINHVENIEYIKLIMRSITMIFSAYTTLILIGKIKKYDELRKKEFMLARTDKLTGLANRHYLEQRLEEEVSFSDETGSPLNVIIFDLDCFKKFNDSYGHVCGDKLLELFSHIIKQNIRRNDIPIRYGGEEFLLMVRDLDIHVAKRVADRIRSQLENQMIYSGKDPNRTRVTVSCGVAQYPKHSTDIKKVIDYADKALYSAKENGKNKVVLFDEVEHIDINGQIKMKYTGS